ncbi:MAG: hypothetical protein AVO33_05835 [delta proteobacterium ML8_F1]|nr:MAG: hypothetical protein AVO33_05835 [delta proteobacterium ML8_F1]
MKPSHSSFSKALIIPVLGLLATSLVITALKTGIAAISFTGTGVTLILILGIFLLVASLSNIIITVFILYIFFSLLSIVSSTKFAKRGIPLIFNDLSLVDELGKFNDVIRIQEYFWPVAVLIVATLLALAYAVRHRRHTALGKRGRCFLLGVLLLLGGCAFAVSNPLDFEDAGPIYGFFASVDLPVKPVLSPEEYQFLATLEKNSPGTSPDSDPPNVIFIMSESFWDPGLLPGVSLEPDPFDTFDAIKDQSLYGRLEVPVFAGGTSNTEFEVLTSLSTHGHPEGYMLFNRDIQGPTPSLAGIFAAQGYHSIGLHPFWGWYYNRDDIYRHLGFEAFISEEYLNQTRTTGHYISDQSALTKIKALIDETSKPLFLYAITMQNHGPYDDGRYTPGAISLTVTADADQAILENFAQGMADSIKALETLLKDLEASDEKTLVVYFGDHLPLLGDNLSSLEGNGLFTQEDSTCEKELKLKTTPLLIWSNYDLPPGKIGILDAIYLGPKILDMAGLDMPGYYRFLLELSQESPLINPHCVQVRDTLHPRGSSAYESINLPLTALYKDLIHGQRLAVDDSWLVTASEAYNRQINDIRIEEVVFTPDTAVIHGGPFYEKARLYINGRDTPFLWQDHVIAVDRKYFDLEENLTLQMTLRNNRNEIIAVSNDYEIKQGP